MRLAIIPARGGSKRLPNKNVRMLGDKLLVNHTIDAAAECFDKVIFSSNDERILIAAQKYSNNRVTYSLRPSRLATDTSDVISTVCFYYDMHKNKGYDEIWLLLPTCPLRNKNHIFEAQNILKDYDGVVSITTPDCPPALQLIERDGLINGLNKKHLFNEGNTYLQEQAETYMANGAIYGYKWDKFDKARNFYKGRVAGYYMPKEVSVNINSEFDFRVAQIYL